MSKFATLLLKIILVISFIGIIVFVAFAIINNQNISYEAYNYVSNAYLQTNFDSLKNNVNANMKSSYNGEVDEYAKYINSAINEVNKGSKYFLNYLSVEKDLTKGEQDKLRSLFDNYLSNFNKALNAYNDYITSYQDADYQYTNNFDNSSVALSIVISKCVYFVERYTDCYVSGSQFLKYLVDITNKYSFQNCFSYKEQAYLIKVGIVDNTTNYVLENMKNKKENRAYNTNVRDNDLIDCFYDFLGKEQNFKEENLITNSNFQQFVLNLNSLNIYSWAGNYENYKSSLKDEVVIAKCENAKNFFVLNFRG